MASGGCGKYALIIADRPPIASLFSDELHRLGYSSVNIAGGEQDAIAAAKIRLPDLLVADDRITKGSAIRAVRTICLETGVPAVFMIVDPARLADMIPHAVIVDQPIGARTLSEAIRRSQELSLKMSA